MLSFRGRYSSARSLYSYGAATTVGTSQTNATLLPVSGVTIPKNALGLNSSMLIFMEFSCPAAAGTTITLTLNDGGGASTICSFSPSATSARARVRMGNRNSLSSQRSSLDSTVNVTAVTAVATTTEDTSLDCTLSVLATTGATNNITLETILIMVIP